MKKEMIKTLSEILKCRVALDVCAQGGGPGGATMDVPPPHDDDDE